MLRQPFRLLLRSPDVIYDQRPTQQEPVELICGERGAKRHQFCDGSCRLFRLRIIGYSFQTEEMNCHCNLSTQFVFFQPCRHVCREEWIPVRPRSHRTRSPSQQAHANYGTHCSKWEYSHRLQATSKGLHANLPANLLTCPV